MTATPAIDRILASWMKTGRIMRQRMSSLQKEKGMNPLQLHGLIIIREHDGITMKEFADHLRVTSPTATSFANRLVKLGWITRKHDLKNRKLVRLHISLSGQKIV